MRLLKRTLLLFTLSIIFFSCKNNTARQATQGNFYTPKYANGFCIDTINGEKTLHVFNPFQHSQELTYNYTIDSTVRRVACMSTTHVAMLNFIGQRESIVGVAGANLVYDSLLQAKYAAKQLPDMGYDTQLNVELLLSLHPDIIFAYGISGEFTSIANKLQELGLRVVYIGEYTEEHPLGKAEWVVAMATFFNCEALAIEKFEQVGAEYEEMRVLASTAANTTKTLLNAPWGDAWFVPGKRGNMATLLHDANAESVITLHNQRDSYPISIERAYSEAQHATVWLNPGQASSLNELSNMHKLIENIPPYQRREVYNNNARMCAAGGSDFFESGTVNPQVILKDLIKILHPKLLPYHELFYYQKLN